MMSAKLGNKVKEQIGINKVRNVVQNLWCCGWQQYGAENDDAVDGVILMRRGEKNPTDTGGVVYVQVKCGGDGYREDQKQYPNHIGIAIGKDYIEKHRSRWARVPGPMVLIFVDDTIDRENPPAWWVNLRDPNCISPTNGGIVLVPKAQEFKHHVKSEFHRLCGPGGVDRLLPTFSLSRKELLIPKLGKDESLRNDAWSFYKLWRDTENLRTSPCLGEILINRVGWKHMTRQWRASERIVQSWSLLGVAQQMVMRCDEYYNLGHAKNTKFSDGNTNIIDYLGLRANIVFPHRDGCVAQVVLKRSRLLCPKYVHQERQKIWFYSIYEMRRGRSQV